MNPTATVVFDIREIMSMLAHRYPFLLVDRVIEYTPGQTLLGLKNVTYNEPFFPGHFPKVPTMPGVLILEALAQCCGLLAVRDTGIRPADGFILYFASIESARFKKPVVPGDQIHLSVRLDKQKRSVWKFTTQALVAGEVVCEAQMTCFLKEAGRDGDRNLVEDAA
jgi:3-hydroxyacyl-[acyl-carrier-protein] dehydratase